MLFHFCNTSLVTEPLSTALKPHITLYTFTTFRKLRFSSSSLMPFAGCVLFKVTTYFLTGISFLVYTSFIYAWSFKNVKWHKTRAGCRHCGKLKSCVPKLHTWQWFSNDFLICDAHWQVTRIFQSLHCFRQLVTLHLLNQIRMSVHWEWTTYLLPSWSTSEVCWQH